MQVRLLGRCLIAVIALTALPAVVAQEKGLSSKSRADMKKLFDKTKDAYERTQSPSRRGDSESARFSPTEVDGQPVASCIRIWAVLANRQGQEISGPINMALHKWQPDERFYLYFESATPIMVSLYQLYPETGHPNAGETRVVLPDPNFPASLEAIPPGCAVRMPVLMKMDHTLVDEMMGIAIQCVGLCNQMPCGNPILDRPAVTVPGAAAEPTPEPTPTPAKPEGGAAAAVNPADSADAGAVSGAGATIATRSVRFSQEIGKVGFSGKDYKIPENARFSVVSVQTDPDCTDDYAIVACPANHLAFLKITLHKD